MLHAKGLGTIFSGPTFAMAGAADLQPTAGDGSPKSEGRVWSCSDYEQHVPLWYQPKMETSLPIFHEQLLTEGCTKKGMDLVLAQAFLCPQGDTNDPGLVYVLVELISDIKVCKYGFRWDTFYHNCHCGIFASQQCHTCQ
jgi:hypothetical protein